MDYHKTVEFSLPGNEQAHFEISQSKVPYKFVPLHWHDTVEIISVVEGELSVIVNQHQYQLQDGNCIILNPYVLHSSISDGSNIALSLRVPLNVFTDFTGRVTNRRFICDPMTSDPAHKKQLKQISELLKEIVELEQSGDSMAHLHSISLFWKLLHELYVNFSQPDSGAIFRRNKKRFDRLLPAIAYTKAHYSEVITLESVAREQNMQTNAFRRSFKKNVGITYIQYLNEYRLAKVYHDLLTTDIPIKILIERHGFTSPKRFRELFYRKFKTLPSAARNDK